MAPPIHICWLLRHKYFVFTSRVSLADVVVALRMKSKNSQNFTVLDERYLHIVTVTTEITGSLPFVPRKYSTV